MRKQFEATPAINHNVRVCISNLAKTEAFADFLAAVHRAQPDTREFHAHISRTVLDFATMIPIDPHTSESLRTSPVFPINSLNPSPARACATHAYSQCGFRLQYFPTQWKNAVVITIVKPGKNPSDSSSYLPISLLSTMTKLVEKVILSRISRVADRLAVVSEEQFAINVFFVTYIVRCLLLEISSAAAHILIWTPGTSNI